MNSLAKLVGFILSVAVAAVPLAADAGALKTRGLWVQFEERGWASGYWPGQVIQQFNQLDDVGHKVSDEVALQLDAMRGMGVNTITIELRAADADGDFTFPKCDIHPVLGFQWPQPTATELANITPFLDLIHSKGIKVILVLTNTHMQELPRTNSQTWLGAILNVVKNHPALDFVVFNGDARTIDTNNDGIPDTCGIPAEAPLWLGATAYAGSYVTWAIGYAMNSLGMPASKLSSGAIVGNYFTDSGAACGQGCTDGHLWKPVAVLKSIFDSLNVPNNQRVYALSFYEHRKCLTAQFLQCTEADPPTWADQTLQDVYNVIGTNSGARVVAYEMGNNVPVDSNWSTSNALANLVAVLKKYGADGGSFWRWTSFNNSEDTDSTLAQPIKLRGVAFNYTAVKSTLVQAYKPPASTHDVDGDTLSDVVWYHGATGTVAGWLMNGFQIQQSGGYGAVSTNWTIVGQRDFNGDGIGDLLWRDSVTGTPAIWLLNGFQVLQTGQFSPIPNNWVVAGTGDFDGDGKGDILWYHGPSGTVAIWLMNGVSVLQTGTPGVLAGWTIVGTGDFDGDGKSDILWYHTPTGTVGVWLMAGLSLKQGGTAGAVPTNWVIVGTGDFNGDGKSDILWRDNNTGTVAVWFMNGISLSQSGGYSAVASNWHIIETGDFNGDGKSDILWRDTNSGAVAIWLLNGLQVMQTGIVSTIPLAWSIVGANSD